VTENEESAAVPEPAHEKAPPHPLVQMSCVFPSCDGSFSMSEERYDPTDQIGTWVGVCPGCGEKYWATVGASL